MKEVIFIVLPWVKRGIELMAKADTGLLLNIEPFRHSISNNCRARVWTGFSGD